MSIFDEMLAAYTPQGQAERVNAIHEIMQQITLAALSKHQFFEHAAFYGGTCLRIFHQLPRFSEDMVFSLLHPDSSFSLEPWFQAIIDEFSTVGQVVSISQKNKTQKSAILSAFLKSDTAQYNLHLARGQNIKIKIEVDTNPPGNFATEQKLQLLPHSFYTRCYTLPCLFAGKMHALIYRSWQNRPKGRDWFDFEWYVRRQIPMDFTHFKQRVVQFSSEKSDVITPEFFVLKLKEKIRTTSIDAVKQDVFPFIKDVSVLDVWNTDYFLTLCDLVKIV